MLATARTFTLDGIAARPVRVEVDVHRGLPGFAIVGLPDAAVREARERVRAALVNCGFEFPLRRIVVNLAPASLRKAGPGMDLAIASALLSASGQLEWEALSRVALAGELALDGSTRPVAGALAIAEAAREGGADAVVVPAENGPEAALARGIDVIALDGLGRLPGLVAGEWEPPRPEALPLQLGGSGAGPDLADLRGQPHLRHALEVAAAGGHSLLMIGPPGAGKSLAASRLPSILPPLAVGEALEVARIASACGRLNGSLSGGRPFRAPHHTISPAGLVGGGSPPKPGEATLAHRGVLQCTWVTARCQRCAPESPRWARHARAGDATGRRPVPCAPLRDGPLAASQRPRIERAHDGQARLDTRAAPLAASFRSADPLPTPPARPARRRRGAPYPPRSGADDRRARAPGKARWEREGGPVSCTISLGDLDFRGERRGRRRQRLHPTDHPRTPNVEGAVAM